jgi:hypothetical protein
MSTFSQPDASNQLPVLDLSFFGLMERLLIHVNRMAALNIQTQHVAQVVCASLSATVALN